MVYLESRLGTWPSMSKAFGPACAFLVLFLYVLCGTALSGPVMVLSMDDSITPASDDILDGAIESSKINDAEALVIVLDTPGGGLEETLNIAGQIEQSDVPVIGYVYPSGAKAWSAGTLILLSSDLAAMAPNTIIGSAQPVTLSATGESVPVNDSKTKNAIVALIEEKARMHGRNTSAAREFVLSNLNLNSEQAYEYGVVEVIAPDLPTLMQKIDGMVVKNKTMNTSSSELIYYEPDLRMKLLLILSDPTISGLLMLLGIYAFIFGISNPGLGAEVFGLISIALGLMGLGFDVNLGAIFLIILGMALIVLELHAHSFGILGLGGMICILAGTILFAPVSFPKWYLPGEYQKAVIWTFMIPSLVLGGFFAFAVYKVAQARLRPTFDEEISHEEAEVLERLDPEGFVLYRGEYWDAMADETIEKGEFVKVVGKDGRVLKVQR